MARTAVAVSRASRDALAVLGGQIKAARLARGWTQADLAGRIGVDARTLSAVERGAPNVMIGTAFHAALTAGVDLFGLDGDGLALARRRGEEVLALLPTRVRRVATDDRADDDF